MRDTESDKEGEQEKKRVMKRVNKRRRDWKKSPGMGRWVFLKVRQRQRDSEEIKKNFKR